MDFTANQKPSMLEVGKAFNFHIYVFKIPMHRYAYIVSDTKYASF